MTRRLPFDFTSKRIFFNINRLLCCVMIIIFCELQTLLSLECILRKFHVNCHSATVNILITIVRIFFISKKNSEPLKSTHFPLPRHSAFLVDPPCIFLAHFLGASVIIVLKGGRRDTSDSRGESSPAPSALNDFPGYRIFVACQTWRAVHIPAESVAVQPVVTR